MSRERTNEPSAVRRGQTISLATLELSNSCFFFFILFCAHSPETNERIFHFCSAARDDAIIQLDEILLFSHCLSRLSIYVIGFLKNHKTFIYFFVLGVNNSNCFVTFELFILCCPPLPPFLTLINNSSFVKHVSEWFFAPWERNLSWPRFFFLVIARRETEDANDRLDPQSVRHSTIFLADLNIFFPPPSNRDFGGLGCRDLTFFEKKTRPKSNSNEGFHSIAVKCKKLVFLVKKIVFQVDGKDDIF